MSHDRDMDPDDRKRWETKERTTGEQAYVLGLAREIFVHTDKDPGESFAEAEAFVAEAKRRGVLAWPT